LTCFLRELGLQALSRSPAVASPRAKGTAASPQICRPRSCCTPSVDPDAWLANIAPRWHADVAGPPRAARKRKTKTPRRSPLPPR
jgi:hypothetical protein